MKSWPLRSALSFVLALGLLLGVVERAVAHDEGLSLTASFNEGFWHPITGYDHLIAMVAVGLLSVVIGGRAVFAVPGAFVTFLLIGGAFGFESVALVSVEWWILGSLLLLGTVLAVGAKPAASAVFAGVALFGFAHGNAHGLELPMASKPLGYAMGFAVASVVCHLTGVGIGAVASRTRWGRTPVRALGWTTVGASVFLTSSLVVGG